MNDNPIEPASSLPSDPEPTHDWTDFSLRKFLRDLLRDVEKRYIRDALRDTDGSVTKAARLLGFKHHNQLIALINGRHPDLLTERTPIQKRRRPLITRGSKHKSMQRKRAREETQHELSR